MGGKAMAAQTQNRLYGMIAQFGTPAALMEAVKKARAEGFTKMDAYSPFPIHGLSEELGFRKTRLTALILAGGCTGAILGFSMLWSSAAYFYPINVAGRPYFSWEAFIPITFECGILFAALSAVMGMLGLNGLPQPYHPLFNSEAFAHASRDKFFLCVESTDPKFDEQQTRQFLESLNPEEIDEVAP
jgi:Alternative complex III, ActD subunit